MVLLVHLDILNANGNPSYNLSTEFYQNRFTVVIEQTNMHRNFYLYFPVY